MVIANRNITLSEIISIIIKKRTIYIYLYFIFIFFYCYCCELDFTLFKQDVSFLSLLWLLKCYTSLITHFFSVSVCARLLSPQLIALLTCYLKHISHIGGRVHSLMFPSRVWEWAASIRKFSAWHVHLCLVISGNHSGSGELRVNLKWAYDVQAY